MNIEHNSFNAGNLKLCQRPPDFWGERLPAVGDKVRLVSGGPALLVVDISRERQTAVVAWHDQTCVRELELPHACLIPNS